MALTRKPSHQDDCLWLVVYLVPNHDTKFGHKGKSILKGYESATTKNGESIIIREEAGKVKSRFWTYIIGRSTVGQETMVCIPPTTGKGNPTIYVKSSQLQ